MSPLSLTKFFVLTALIASCGITTEQTSQLTDENEGNSANTTDYLYDSPLRIARFDTRVMGPTPVYFRDHIDPRAGIDFPWNNAHGLMVRAAGDTVTFSYERKASDDGQTGSIESVTAFYRLPGSSDIQSLALAARGAGPFPEGFAGTINTSASDTGILEYWFEVKTSTGAQSWDSQFGRNYGVYMVANKCAVLKFDNVRDGV